MGTGPAAGRTGVDAGLAPALIVACIGIALALALASLWWPGAFDLLVLEPGQLARGQFWRLWSGHLAHIDAPHAALNLAGAGLLALIARRRHELGALLRVNALMMPLLSVVLLWLMPPPQAYAGLSGLLHGWAAWLLLRRGGWIGTAGLLLIALKLLLESLPGYPVQYGFPVVLEAHRAGALIGLLVGLPWKRSPGKAWPHPGGLYR